MTENDRPADRQRPDIATSKRPMLDFLIELGATQSKGTKTFVNIVFWLIMAAAGAVVLAAIASRF